MINTKKTSNTKNTMRYYRKRNFNWRSWKNSTRVKNRFKKRENRENKSWKFLMMTISRTKTVIILSLKNRRTIGKIRPSVYLSQKTRSKTWRKTFSSVEIARMCRLSSLITTNSKQIKGHRVVNTLKGGGSNSDS